MSRSPWCAACSWRYIARFTAVALFALTTSAPAAVVRPRGRMFGGRTAQSDPFVLALSHSRRAIDHAVLWVDADCDNGDDISYSAVARLRGAVDARGHVRAKAVDARDYGNEGGSAVERLTGRIGATRAAGTLSVTVTLVD